MFLLHTHLHFSTRWVLSINHLLQCTSCQKLYYAMLLNFTHRWRTLCNDLSVLVRPVRAKYQMKPFMRSPFLSYMDLRSAVAFTLSQLSSCKNLFYTCDTEYMFIHLFNVIYNYISNSGEKTVYHSFNSEHHWRRERVTCQTGDSLLKKSWERSHAVLMK